VVCGMRAADMWHVGLRAVVRGGASFFLPIFDVAPLPLRLAKTDSNNQHKSVALLAMRLAIPADAANWAPEPRTSRTARRHPP
jgi:hypothetical protein